MQSLAYLKFPFLWKKGEWILEHLTVSAIVTPITGVVLGSPEEWFQRGSNSACTVGLVPWPHFTDEELSSREGSVRARSRIIAGFPRLSLLTCTRVCSSGMWHYMPSPHFDPILLAAFWTTLCALDSCIQLPANTPIWVPYRRLGHHKSKAELMTSPTRLLLFPSSQSQ